MVEVKGAIFSNNPGSFRGCVAVMIEDINANGAGEAAASGGLVDFFGQGIDGQPLMRSDILQGIPEGGFQRNAGFMPLDGDRALDLAGHVSILPEC